MQAFKALVAAVLLAASVAANGTPLTDLYDDSLRTDFSADLFLGGLDLVTYDASDDRLTFTAQQLVPGEYSVCSRGSCSPTQSNLFQWSGRVDKHGRVSDPGSFSWFADFGSGMELLGNGRLLELGVSDIGEFETGVRVYGNLQFLFDFDFRSSRISEETDRALLFVNRQLWSRDLFASDFACGTNVSIGLDPEQHSCEAWSNTGLVGQRAVPEPGTIALFGLGLAGLAFTRRRRTRTSLR